MTLYSGFFNSLDGDRKYDANDFSKLFDGIIVDGVFPTVGDKFVVLADSPDNSMTVRVGTGRAFFEGHWVYNDASIPLAVSAAHPTLNRKDGVILKVDQRDAVRACSIYIKAGTPAVTPEPIGLYEDAEQLEILLAEITVSAGATAIPQSKIKSYIGTSYCPYVTGPLTTINVDDQYADWEDAFNTWFGNLQDLLTENAETNITNRLLVLEADKVKKDKMITRLVVSVAEPQVSNKGSFPNVAILPNQVLEVVFMYGNTVANPTITINGITYTLSGVPTKPYAAAAGTNWGLQRYKFAPNTSGSTVLVFIREHYITESQTFAYGNITTGKYTRYADGTIEASVSVNKGSNLVFSAKGALYASDEVVVEFPSKMFSEAFLCDGGVIATTAATAFFVHRTPTYSNYIGSIKVLVAKTDSVSANYRINFHVFGRWF